MHELARWLLIGTLYRFMTPARVALAEDSDVIGDSVEIKLSQSCQAPTSSASTGSAPVSSLGGSTATWPRAARNGGR